MVNAQHNAPRVGKDPSADAILEQSAKENEELHASLVRETISRQAAEARARGASGQTDPKTGKVTGYTRNPKGAESVAAAGATAAPTSAPAVGSAAGSSAEVVPKTQGPQSTSLAVAPPRWELQVQPKTVEGMMWMAERLHSARVFSAFGSVEEPSGSSPSGESSAWASCKA
jgi:hypothetical protein